MSGALAKWMPYRRPGSEQRVRLFCFPFGGGGASSFALWRNALPPHVDLCAMQPPARESRLGEPAITRIPDMVAALVQVVEPLLDLPFALFGHSVGSLVAFELARELRDRGRRLPMRLFVSGHPAPHLPRRRPLISGLPREEFIAALRDSFEVSPALLDSADLLDVVLPSLYGDYALVESYAYRNGPPLAMPLTAFCGTCDPEADPAEIQQWRRETTGPFRAVVLDGAHMFVNSSRTALLQEIAADLASSPA